MYMVTLSFSPSNYKHYKATIKRIWKDSRNTVVTVVKQMGSQNTHKHYHLFVVPKEGTKRSTFRRRFISYMKPQTDGEPQLKVQKFNHPGAYWNYVRRDSSWKLIKTRGRTVEEYNRDSLVHPDRPNSLMLAWWNLKIQLDALGFQKNGIRENPGPYLKKIEALGYNVLPYVQNPKRLALTLRYWYDNKHGDDWGAVYYAQDAKQSDYSP